MKNPRIEIEACRRMPTRSAGDALLRYGLAFGILLAGLFHAQAGYAQSKGSGLESGPVVIYTTPDDQRRAELRRALVSSEEMPAQSTPRRRLTAEERNALHLELREAVRGAYRQRPDSDR